MSMQNYACYDDVVQESTIKKFCKKEWGNFQKAWKDSEVDWDDTAMALSNGDNVVSEVKKAYDELRDAFERNTGLTLSLGYRIETEGVEDGSYWVVGGVYELTEAGKKMDGYVEREFWTVFG